MVKSIYIDSQNIKDLDKSSANHLIVTDRTISQDYWASLKNKGFTLSIAVDAFGRGECPVKKENIDKLFSKISRALEYQPTEIWLDYFRFGGDCTDIEDTDIEKAHPLCQWCEDINRVDFILDLAGKVKMQMGSVKLGFFTVAFKSDSAPKLSQALGLDYAKLGNILDISSPMLYHKMIKKSVSYISEYTSWMFNVSGKPVLPIIQIKDMPDDLPDEITEEEIRQEIAEAIKDPSIGVCIFWWNHALEKDKTGIVSRLLNSI